MAQPTPVDVNSIRIIPEVDAKRRRTLVLCFDGTGDQFDADNSNVIQFFTMLQKDNRDEQMVYYQAGIGTYTVPQIATPLYSKISKSLDAAIAWNLDAHVMDGYTFLMQNYQAGDKISIFGFSRGAYTARSLAGMVHKIGLLPACNHQQVPFAYKMYTRTDEVGWKQSVAFKKAFSVDVEIDFVGVWDTVCSVGLIPKRLPFVSNNTAIRCFRHAVSLDERRAKFKANLYNRPTEAEEKLGVQPGEMPPPSTAPIPASATLEAMQKLRKWAASGKTPAEIEEEQDDRFETQFEPCEHSIDETDVLEVWFSGCHCDVGGGSVSNDTPHNLARIPLRWMIRQCFLANTGIRFHTHLLRHVGLDPASLYPIVKERPEEIYATPENIVALAEKSAAQHAFYRERAAARHHKGKGSTAAPNPFVDPNSLSPEQQAPAIHDRTESNKTLVDSPSDPLALSVPAVHLTEEEEDLLDSVCPIYDQLNLAWGWWVLEVVPLMQRYQREDNNEWVDELVVNMGGPRWVPHVTPDSPFRVHRSVKMRMEAGEKGLVMLDEKGKKGAYRPKPKLREITWVA